MTTHLPLCQLSCFDSAPHQLIWKRSVSQGRLVPASPGRAAGSRLCGQRWWGWWGYRTPPKGAYGPLTGQCRDSGVSPGAPAVGRAERGARPDAHLTRRAKRSAPRGRYPEGFSSLPTSPDQRGCGVDRCPSRATQHMSAADYPCGKVSIRSTKRHHTPAPHGSRTQDQQRTPRAK